MATPIRARPRFPHRQCFPSQSFHKPLIHQRADRKEITITENQPNWSLGSQPCVTQWNYKPCHVGPPMMDGSWWRVLTKRGLLEKGLADHFSTLALRTPWTVWKGKDMTPKDELPSRRLTHIWNLLRKTGDGGKWMGCLKIRTSRPNSL